jgi:hypothetical protein
MKLQLDNKTFLDLAEVVDKTGMNLITIRNYIKEGKLNAKKVGVKYWVSETALAEFFETGSSEPVKMKQAKNK